MMSGDDVLTMPVARRIEVFTGAGLRRRWSAETKARIVAESYVTSVGEVADRYGVVKNQLFGWRRDAEDGTMRLSAAQLGALLEGLDWRRVHQSRRTRVPVAAN